MFEISLITRFSGSFMCNCQIRFSSSEVLSKNPYPLNLYRIYFVKLLPSIYHPRNYIYLVKCKHHHGVRVSAPAYATQNPGIKSTASVPRRGTCSGGPERAGPDRAGGGPGGRHEYLNTIQREALRCDTSREREHGGQSNPKQKTAREGTAPGQVFPFSFSHTAVSRPAIVSRAKSNLCAWSIRSMPAFPRARRSRTSAMVWAGNLMHPVVPYRRRTKSFLIYILHFMSHNIFLGDMEVSQLSLQSLLCGCGYAQHLLRVSDRHPDTHKQIYLYQNTHNHTT